MNFVYITIVTVAVYSSLPLVSAECVDKNGYCYRVKNNRGMCNRSLFIKSNCQLSCGFCSSKDECVDKNDYCYRVKNNRGMCNRSSFIKSNCRLSCGFCSSKDECVDKNDYCYRVKNNRG